ncbi:hypothetical protein H8E77_10430, partial [bacterium]|nr:hypothetical protein [bacterium]
MRFFGSGSKSFLISAIVHGVAFVVLSVYLIVQHPKVQEMIETTFFEQKKQAKPKRRPPVVKTVPKPVISTEQPIVTTVQVTPRITTSAAVRVTSIQADTVLQFSNKYVAFDAKINPNAPRVVNPSRPVPQVVTHADLPVSDAPGALDFAAPVASGTGGGPPIGRGIIGSGIKEKVFLLSTMLLALMIS